MISLAKCKADELKARAKIRETVNTITLALVLMPSLEESAAPPRLADVAKMVARSVERLGSDYARWQAALDAYNRACALLERNPG